MKTRKTEMKANKTIGSLLRYIAGKYSEEVKYIADHHGADFLAHMSQDVTDLIWENITLFRLSNEKAQLLIDNGSVPYQICNTKDDVKFLLLADYLAIETVNMYRYKRTVFKNIKHFIDCRIDAIKADDLLER